MAKVDWCWCILLFTLCHCVTSVSGVCNNNFFNDLKNDKSKNKDRVFSKKTRKFKYGSNCLAFFFGNPSLHYGRECLRGIGNSLHWLHNAISTLQNTPYPFISQHLPHILGLRMLPSQRKKEKLFYHSLWNPLYKP